MVYLLTTETLCLKEGCHGPAHARLYSAVIKFAGPDNKFACSIFSIIRAFRSSAASTGLILFLDEVSTFMNAFLLLISTLDM